MDNLFDIIIGLVILYSLLSPILSKKKKKTLPPYQAPKEEDSVEVENDNPLPDYSAKSETKQESYDILKEIEELFNQSKQQEKVERDDDWLPKNEEPPIPVKVDKPVDLYSEHVKSEQFEYIPEKAKFPHYKDYKPNSDSTKKPTKINFVPSKANVENKYLTEIKYKLKNPNSFRDAFLLAEIINKPKALRKR